MTAKNATSCMYAYAREEIVEGKRKDKSKRKKGGKWQKEERKRGKRNKRRWRSRKKGRRVKNERKKEGRKRDSEKANKQEDEIYSGANDRFGFNAAEKSSKTRRKNDKGGKKKVFSSQ